MSWPLAARRLAERALGENEAERLDEPARFGLQAARFFVAALHRRRVGRRRISNCPSRRRQSA